MFDKAFKRVNTFVDYKTELVEDDAKVDDDQEEARMKELMNIVPDEEELAIDAILLATKHPCIVDWKIIKEGKISQFQIIRAYRSSKSTLSEVAIYAYLYAGREKGRIVGIKSFIRLFRITAALIKVSTAQEESFYNTSNSKKEERIMGIDEIPKFCDATLKRVLKEFKRINLDVKHGYKDPPLSKEDADLMVFYEEHIQDRLRHQNQKRR
ncbi:hypothetical protein Tco_1309943 [Tanacetum coccineum]